MKDIIAVLCSDIHLSHTPPACRAAEPDWYAAMRRPLYQIVDLAKEHNTPVVIAGDVFDRWSSPPELTNFAIEMFSDHEFYTIPGQHDLPNHNMADMHRSSYGTLVMAEAVRHIHGVAQIGWPERVVYLHAYHWGQPLTPITKEHHKLGGLHVAVVHKYIWNHDHCFPGAPPDGHVAEVRKALAGYDAVVAGDNHSGWHTSLGNIFVPGTLLRRKIDERDYKPQVGLLHPDGTITPHYLDCSEDKFVEVDDLPIIERTESEEIKAFLAELSGLDQDSLDFRQAVNHAMTMKGVTDGVRQRILTAVGG